jgi:acetylornithine deacetylase/succinyl-diaminopimelate desuccinylase-like protein
MVGSRIYGRGTQDIKSIAVKQLLAIRKLQGRGGLKRSVHVAFFPGIFLYN